MNKFSQPIEDKISIIQIDYGLIFPKFGVNDMSWLGRLFGKKEEEKAKNSKTAKTSVAQAPAATGGGSIPSERVGLNGEYDESGLAKRVAYAFDQDNQLDDIETLWVAQTGSTVVLKGKVPSQDLLNQMVSVAKKVDGAASVDTSQVTVS
ncbi:phospholipid-binding protein [Limnoraphis robusta]|uniref:phospholipid-binding protein n=1 Tax=Limnoraphis robusta TaxID=1118279 RepID=UPI003969EF06